MSIVDRIAYDVECMRDYFTRLISFAEASAKNTPQSAAEEQFLPRGIAYLVRPDMTCNVYSLADFWLAELCRYHQRLGGLSVTIDSFKKSEKKCNDLQRYEKYLTKIALIDLSAVRCSFSRIDSLRKVRNIFIHGGGHALDNKFQAIAATPDVSIQGSLVVVTDRFVWQSLDHVSRYLRYVAAA
jgi:hypothetical protein